MIVAAALDDIERKGAKVIDKNKVEGKGKSKNAKREIK